MTKYGDHYEVSIQNNLVPNSTVSEESIPVMILGKSKRELSVKAEEDPRPRRHKKVVSKRIDASLKSKEKG